MPFRMEVYALVKIGKRWRMDALEVERSIFKDLAKHQSKYANEVFLANHFTTRYTNRFIKENSR